MARKEVQTVVLPEVPPEPLGNRICLRLVEQTATKQGIYLPGQSDQIDEVSITKTYTVHEFGDDVDETVRAKLDIGQEVYMEFVPSLHSIVAEEFVSKDECVYYIFVLPQHIAGKVRDTETNKGKENK